MTPGRVFAAVFAFCALFFLFGTSVLALASGFGIYEAVISIYGKTGAMLGVALAFIAAAALAHYVDSKWQAIKNAAEKLSQAAGTCGARRHAYFDVDVEIADAAEKLYEIERRLETIRKQGAEWEGKSKYLAQTEQALLNILEDVEEANTKLKELDQLKTDFLNVTSHELRTPLTPIIAYVDMMEKGRLGPINSEQQRALDAVRRNASRLKLLITDILDIAKLEGKRMKYVMEPHNVARIVASAAADQQAFAKEKNVRITVENMPKLPKLRIDGCRITQVVSNVINNAIKFSDVGGEVRVKVTLTQKEVVVAVSDTGMGIPADDVPKLFNMFYQSRRTMTRNPEGSGLGLAICKWIVQDHGGRIWAASKIGEGSVFTFALPRKYSPKTKNIVKNILETGTAQDAKRQFEKETKWQAKVV